jgi:release factor glutamine methyltransferase
MKAKPLTISQALKEGSDFLGTEIDNAYHEALILLQHATHRTKEYLIAHAEETVREDCLSRFRQYLERRDHGEPIAYIVEEKEFWSLPFYVTQGVLIPRPETEQLVESTLELLKNRSHAKILDLGAGCGCIALSIAKEKPDTQVTACDISDACLNVAQVNAQNLNIHNVSFVRSHWFSAITPGDFDIIVCNPPYISEDDQLIEEAVEKYEPDIALFSDNHGLEDLYHVIENAPGFLASGGSLVLEHGLNQAEAVQNKMRDLNFHYIHTLQDLQNHDRVTMGKLLKQ